ncbi:MAG: DUF4123 domain-containing protein [Desulfovibrio sp.]|jgi:hypothetical protein|nr:DUF4123 domain-containing protein [Desulfovibrio sp.]
MQLYQEINQAPGRWFLLLDGAQTLNIRKVLYEHSPDVYWRPLYLHTELSNLLSISPILIAVEEHSGILQWYLAHEDNCQYGICIYCNSEFNTLLTHLQSLLFADICGEIILFRFYDPQALTFLWRHLSDVEKERMLGPAALWCWPEESREYEWAVITVDKKMTSRTVGYTCKRNAFQRVPLVLRQHTLEGFRADKENAFVHNLAQRFTSRGWAFNPEEFQEAARAALKQARVYNLGYASSLAAFVLFWTTVSPVFHLREPIKGILENPAYHELEKIELVKDALLAMQGGG